MSGKSSLPRPVPNNVPESLRRFMATMHSNSRKVALRQRHAQEIGALRYTRARVEANRPLVRLAKRPVVVSAP